MLHILVIQLFNTFYHSPDMVDISRPYTTDILRYTQFHVWGRKITERCLKTGNDLGRLSPALLNKTVLKPVDPVD